MTMMIHDPHHRSRYLFFLAKAIKRPNTGRVTEYVRRGRVTGYVRRGRVTGYVRRGSLPPFEDSTKQMLAHAKVIGLPTPAICSGDAAVKLG